MIVEQHAYPIFDEDWGADEELLLIEGAETCGLGNWQDIADHIGGRSKEEVDQHYNKIYLNSPDYPIPVMTKEFDIGAHDFAEKRKQRLEARRSSSISIIPKQKPVASVPACHEIQGYMPGRLEFEQEAENDAELTVKDMLFDPEDTEVDVDLKLTVLDIYNSRLTTRAERKRTILSHGLLDYRKLSSIDKKRTKDERDLYNKLKPFARLMTKQDFEKFSTSMMTELKCRHRILELQEYRRNGLRTLDAAAKYERDKAVRLSALNRMPPPINGLTTGGAAGAGAGSTAIGGSLTNGISSAAGSAVGVGLSGSGGVNGTMGTRASTLNGNMPSASTNGTIGANGAVPGQAGGLGALANGGGRFSGKFSKIQIPSASDIVTVNGGGSSTTIRIKKPTVPLDISTAPDVELLSPAEQQICSQLKIMPKPYLAIKEVIFRELTRTGGVIKRKTVKELLKIEPVKCNRIFDFFQSQNWI